MLCVRVMPSRGLGARPYPLPSRFRVGRPLGRETRSASCPINNNFCLLTMSAVTLHVQEM